MDNLLDDLEHILTAPRRSLQDRFWGLFLLAAVAGAIATTTMVEVRLWLQPKEESIVIEDATTSQPNLPKPADYRTWRRA